MSKPAVAAHGMDEHTTMLSCSVCGILGPCQRDTDEVKHTQIAMADHLQQAHGAASVRIVENNT